MPDDLLPTAGLLDLAGTVAVVTGGAGGIGRACARRLADAGSVVYCADLAGPASGDEPGLTDVVLDVTDPAATDVVVDRVVGAHDRLDFWINAAGILPRAGVLDIDLDQWRRVQQVNVEGAFLGARAAGRQMAARGRGVIVNVASTAVFRVSANSAHYRASKAAVVALTESLAVELGPLGIRAIALCPTLTMTDTVRRLEADGDAPGLGRWASRLPLQRAADPDDVARAALFAVSPMASFLTGCALPVDGGEIPR